MRHFSILLAASMAMSLSAQQAFALAPFAAQDDRARDRAASRVVTDELGRRVLVPVMVRRIVSLAPNLTETVYALGAGDRLVGDTTYCDTPPEAALKPHVGGPQNASVEAIIALRPDLVFATMINREETVDALAHLGIPVYTTDPHTVRDLIDSIGRMAELIGAGKRGARLVTTLNGQLDRLHARLAGVPPVPVLFVVWLDPPISVGQNTFIADALRYAGARSVISSKQNWPQISLEEVVRVEPTYLVLAGHTGEEGQTLQNLRRRQVWKDLDAVKSGHVIVMSEEINRPSPALIDSIEQLARGLHPALGTDPGGDRSTRGPKASGAPGERSPQCLR
jgi:iron complex transport system substrate-binding protein